MAFCPKCRRPFEDQAGFCPFDGAELVDGAGPHKETQLEDPTSSKIIAVSAVGDEGSAAVQLLIDAKLGAAEEKEPYANLIGKTLDGRYRIDSVLGEGGMGIVFLAKHVLIEKLVAVKILKRDAARNDSVKKRFVREAKAASRIGHPNIIDVTDFGTTKNGITYTVMEYVQGSTLSQVIHYEAALPMTRLLRISAQMAAALEAAHAVGVVHRDLKPDNVFLVNRDGRPDFVKIVDFGIARMLPIPGDSVVSRLTRVGTVFGTPEYMAPEQASGRNDTDHRVDIYALGTIMYEMLCGAVPHKGDSTVRTLAMQMLDPIPPIATRRTGPAVPADIEAIVMKALEKKREDRWQDMNTMLRAIRQVLGDDAGERKTMAHGALQPEVTTMLDGVETEVDVHPAGEAAAETLEHKPLEGGGMTAAPTVVFAPKAPAGEPLFVRRPRQPSVADLHDREEPAPPRSRLWLAALAIVILVAGGAAAIALRGGDRAVAGQGDLDASAAPVDATALASNGAADAGAMATARDAGATSDGGKRPGGGRRPSIGAADASVGGGPLLEIEVITRPEGGSLFIDGVFAGPDRTVMSRPTGTVLKIGCKLRGHLPGAVTVVFKHDANLGVCRMKARTRCVAGIKNPYIKCP